MNHRACAYQVFDDGFFFKKHRNDDPVFLERSQRDPVGYATGDELISGAEGDLVILLGKRLITRFSGLMDGEREGFSVVMDFQQRAFAYPGALVMNRIGELLADVALRFSLNVGGIMAVQAAVAGFKILQLAPSPRNAQVPPASCAAIPMAYTI